MSINKLKAEEKPRLELTDTYLKRIGNVLKLPENQEDFGNYIDSLDNTAQFLNSIGGFLLRRNHYSEDRKIKDVLSESLELDELGKKIIENYLLSFADGNEEERADFATSVFILLVQKKELLWSLLREVPKNGTGEKKVEKQTETTKTETLSALESQKISEKVSKHDLVAFGRTRINIESEERFFISLNSFDNFIPDIELFFGYLQGNLIHGDITKIKKENGDPNIGFNNVLKSAKDGRMTQRKWENFKKKYGKTTYLFLSGQIEGTSIWEEKHASGIEKCGHDDEKALIFGGDEKQGSGVDKAVGSIETSLKVNSGDLKVANKADGDPDSGEIQEFREQTEKRNIVEVSSSEESITSGVPSDFELYWNNMTGIDRVMIKIQISLNNIVQSNLQIGGNPTNTLEKISDFLVSISQKSELGITDFNDISSSGSFTQGLLIMSSYDNFKESLMLLPANQRMSFYEYFKCVTPYGILTEINRELGGDIGSTVSLYKRTTGFFTQEAWINFIEKYSCVFYRELSKIKIHH